MSKFLKKVLPNATPEHRGFGDPEKRIDSGAKKQVFPFRFSDAREEQQA